MTGVCEDSFYKSTSSTDAFPVGQLPRTVRGERRADSRTPAVHLSGTGPPGAGHLGLNSGHRQLQHPSQKQQLKTTHLQRQQHQQQQQQQQYLHQQHDHQQQQKQRQQYQQLQQPKSQQHTHQQLSVQSPQQQSPQQSFYYQQQQQLQHTQKDQRQEQQKQHLHHYQSQQHHYHHHQQQQQQQQHQQQQQQQQQQQLAASQVHHHVRMPRQQQEQPRPKLQHEQTARTSASRGKNVAPGLQTGSLRLAKVKGDKPSEGCGAESIDWTPPETDVFRVYKVSEAKSTSEEDVHASMSNHTKDISISANGRRPSSAQISRPSGEIKAHPEGRRRRPSVPSAQSVQQLLHHHLQQQRQHCQQQNIFKDHYRQLQESKFQTAPFRHHVSKTSRPAASRGARNPTRLSDPHGKNSSVCSTKSKSSSRLVERTGEVVAPEQKKECVLKISNVTVQDTSSALPTAEVNGTVSKSTYRLDPDLVHPPTPRSILKNNHKHTNFIAASNSTTLPVEFSYGSDCRARLVQPSQDFSLNDFLRSSRTRTSATPISHPSAGQGSTTSVHWTPARRAVSASPVVHRYGLGQESTPKRKSVTFNSTVKLMLGDQISTFRSLSVDC